MTVANTDEVESLRAEVVRLAAENAQLRLTPAAMAAEVDAAIRAGDAEKAKAALQRLVEKFPHTPEVGAARKRVEVLVTAQRAAQQEAKRVAAVGFKALKVRPLFASGDNAIGIGDAAIGKRWIFDSYGDGWRFLDAERDKKYVVARMTVSSRSKDPPVFYVPQACETLKPMLTLDDFKDGSLAVIKRID